MNTLEKTIPQTRTRARAGEELGLLVNLLREEKIGYRTLLRNAAEILADDFELLVPAVLILTDKDRIKHAEVTQAEFEDALVAIRCTEEFNGKETIIAAVADAMKLEW